MEELSGATVNGHSGLAVTERLEALSVGEGEAPESPLRGGHPEGLPSEAEPYQAAEPARVAPEGGGSGKPGWRDGEEALAPAEAGPEEGHSVQHQQPLEGGDGPCLGREEEPLPPAPPAPRFLPSGGGAEQGGLPGSEGHGAPTTPGGQDSAGGGAGGSSDSESDSDADTDSSSSVSSSSSSSGLPILSDEDVDQDKDEINPLKQKDEQKLLPVEDVNIVLPEVVELVSFGKVSSVIEHLVIIESLKGLQPVNEDTVLFKDDRQSIGKVFEVFGPVSHPFYVLQFNNPKHIEAKCIKVHDMVYFAPSVENFTQYIFPEKLKQCKGSDASWENDEEPPPEALDFSDDEKESASKHPKKSRNLRKKLRAQQEESNENGTNSQPRRQNLADGSRGCRRGEHNPRFSGGCRRGEYNPSFSRGFHRGEYNPNFSRGCHREEHNPSFSRYRFSHSSSQSFLRQPVRPPQHYIPDSAEPQRPSTCYPHQNRGSPGSYQYSFPPPSFETVSYEANHFPPPPATWGWPGQYIQNAYDPLLALLSLPPPPPPPSPPPPPPSPPPSSAPS